MTILSLPWCYLGGVSRVPLESGELRPPLGRDRRPDDSCRVIVNYCYYEMRLKEEDSNQIFRCNPSYRKQTLFMSIT
eukprot:scaffold7105_cov60-Attheya_sp.AAC.1